MLDHPINSTAAEIAYAEHFAACGNVPRAALVFALEVLAVAADQAREPALIKVATSIKAALRELDYDNFYDDMADLPTAAGNLRNAVNGFIDHHGMDWPNRRQWAEYEKESLE